MAFKDIYGHTRQIRVLRQAITGGRIAHAYLFYGMPGIGKRSTALIFAKALNCRAAQADACDQCPSCRKADHGNHPDLTVIEPAGQSIRIQEIRALQEQMTFSPYEGGRRAFIMTDAEKMNTTAANAMLKTLEEPAAANMLILISPRPYLLPPTILSRCQPLRFNPLPRETVAGYLAERRSIAETAAVLLAAASGGSIGRAIEMNDEDYLSVRNAMLEQVIGEHAENDPLRFFSLAQMFGPERKDILERLNILQACLRDALVYKETGVPDYLMNRDKAEEIRLFAGARSRLKLLDDMRAVERAHRAIEQNANKSLTLETMMFRLAATS